MAKAAPPCRMPQIFHPSFNTLSKVSIFGAVFFLGAGLWAWDTMLRSAYATQVNVAREQPVPFSHKHHVAGLGIDCRFCHTSVEDAGFAGIPPTKTCMGCHSMVWKDAAMLEPVRESYREDRPIEWIRVHDLPDFVYFSHQIHVKQGVGCATCHGPVDKMPLMYQASTLLMEFCIDCHRAPEQYLRPRDQVFNMAYEAPANQLELGLQLKADYNVADAQHLTSCSVCHR
jgi:hypothetical protein